MSTIASTHSEPPGSSSPSGDGVNFSLMSALPPQVGVAQLSHVSSSSCTSQELDRRRRKRTTAHDKAILEAAYQRDAKPDKKARLDIVARVSMNEKEVQIWFQNRRQNDRRKSRPLSLHEVESLRFKSRIAPSASVEHVPCTTTSPKPSHLTAPPPLQYDPLPPGVLTRCPETLVPSCSASRRGILPKPPVPVPHVGSRAPVPRASNGNIAQAASASSQPPQPADSEQSSSSLSSQESVGVGYVCNRLNNESLASSLPATSFGSCLAFPSPAPRPIASDSPKQRTPLSKLLKDAPANPFKITLSLDGKAQIAPSISPPRPSNPYPPVGASSIPRLPPRLNHPRANGTTTCLPPISALLEFVPPRLPRGRSKNSQAWEQIADSSDPTAISVEDSLIAQADDEICGSARAAISLIRHNSSSSLRDVAGPFSSDESNGNILFNNNRKRNAAAASYNARDHKKARLARTASCLARLETRDGWEEKPVRKRKDGHGNEPSKKKGLEVVGGSPTDSDKENWSPNSAGSPYPHARRRVQPARAVDSSRKVLEDNAAGAMGKRLFIGMMTDKKRSTSPGVPIFEDVHPDIVSEECDANDVKRDGTEGTSKASYIAQGSEISGSDEEVERFMKGDVSPSKKGDSDAVRGLLSLKGVWS